MSSSELRPSASGKHIETTAITKQKPKRNRFRNSNLKCSRKHRDPRPLANPLIRHDID